MSYELINFIDVNKSFNDDVKVLHDINLYIRKNEFLTLLGPSGCGKTTTLRIIAGFETPSSGEVLYEGKSILNIPPYKRKVNTVFQKYALFPNMDVYDNVAFGLKLKKTDKKILDQKVKKMLKLVNLEGFESRPISKLSGGQQQRIAIARALINEPDVLLLDEPLGALDLKLRQEMQIELKNMQQQLGITFVYVTHDQEEALSMSDTIAVMNNGIIQQIGTPEDIYNEPKNAFVAAFIGESNILPGTMKKDFEVILQSHTLKCVDTAFKDAEEIDVVIRPEDIEIIDYDENYISGKVVNVKFYGVHYEMFVECNGFTWKIQSTKLSELDKKVSLSISPDSIHIMRRQLN